MKDNGFTKAGIRAMYQEATERMAMIEGALGDKRRIEAAANISDLCGYEVEAQWQGLLCHCAAERTLYLTLLADVD